MTTTPSQRATGGALELPTDGRRRYLLSSHDGFGLGHTRRNAAVAAALVRDPSARVVLVTGVATDLDWLHHPRITVVRVPPLIKDAAGAYRHPTMAFEDALAERRRIHADIVRRWEPDAFLIDRHPYGIAGELRPAVELAGERGTRVVLGLRDILDEPDVIVEELAGAGWADVDELFDHVVVYGSQRICDHVAEYGLPIEPTYCGWVAERAPARARDPHLVAVTGGGGADAHRLYDLVTETARLFDTRLNPCTRPRRFYVVAGPYAASMGATVRRMRVVRSVRGCAALYRRSSAVVQMAGYNSTFESLAAGLRPILMPRRSPRREQAIRAARLAALGLADVLDDATTAAELAWLLGHDRELAAGSLDLAGIDLDGAANAATALAGLVDARVPR